MKGGSILKVGITFESVTLNQESDSKICSMSILGFISGIQKALEQCGYEVTIIGGVKNLIEQIKKNIFDCDLVFNAADGTEPGDKGIYIPSILEAYGIPYTGSHSSTLSVLGNKMFTKLIAKHYGILTPDFYLIENPETFNDYQTVIDRLGFPMIIKAKEESCSISLQKCSDVEELKEGIKKIKAISNQSILCETMIYGQEITVPVLGTGENAKALSVLTYRNREGAILEDIFSIPCKYYEHLICEEAELPQMIRKTAISCAELIHKATNCRSYSRSDFKISKDGQVFFLETNPLSDLDSNGAFGIGAKCQGMEFYEIVDFIVKDASSHIEQ